MKAAAFDYHAPATVDDAVALLGQFGADARLLAGGQSLVPTLTSRLVRPAHVIDLGRMERAERPSVSAGFLRVPPLMRHVDFVGGITEGPLGLLLAELAAGLGSWPVRLRGTLCGALAHADPASRWCLAAVALDALVGARSAQGGARTIAADDLFETIMATTLADEEMIVEVAFPLLPGDARYGFSEVRRRAGDYALALALVTVRGTGLEMEDVHVAVGGVEAVPRRLGAVEAVLQGERPSASLFREAARTAAAAVEPIADPEEEDWRRDLTYAVVLRALERTV